MIKMQTRREFLGSIGKLAIASGLSIPLIGLDTEKAEAYSSLFKFYQGAIPEIAIYHGSLLTTGIAHNPRFLNRDLLIKKFPEYGLMEDGAIKKNTGRYWNLIAALSDVSLKMIEEYSRRNKNIDFIGDSGYIARRILNIGSKIFEEVPEEFKRYDALDIMKMLDITNNVYGLREEYEDSDKNNGEKKNTQPNSGNKTKKPKNQVKKIESIRKNLNLGRSNW